MFFGRRLRGKLPHLPGANDLEISNAKAGADNRKELTLFWVGSGITLLGGGGHYGPDGF